MFENFVQSTGVSLSCTLQDLLNYLKTDADVTDEHILQHLRLDDFPRFGSQIQQHSTWTIQCQDLSLKDIFSKLDLAISFTYTIKALIKDYY